MKKLQLIDFSSVQTDSLIKIEERYFYKNEISKIEELEGSNNFERWFILNLRINSLLITDNLSFDECLNLCYLLKKVGESNPELKELIRIWKEDESQLQSIHKFFVNNILIIYYQLILIELSYDPGVYMNKFNKFIEDYQPRLLKGSDFVKIRKEDEQQIIQQLFAKTGLKIINRLNLGFAVNDALGYWTYTFKPLPQFENTEYFNVIEAISSRSDGLSPSR